MSKDISIEYAHIYTNSRIGDEQKFSLEILKKIKIEQNQKSISLVVMIDDYSFPDPSFDYNTFLKYLSTERFEPDLIIRESQLIPLCDEVICLMRDEKLKKEITQYTKNKKYPCSLFVASWYLLRLGCIQNHFFNSELIANHLINILPVSFKPYEEKAFEIINSTPFKQKISFIENRYFQGREII